MRLLEVIRVNHTEEQQPGTVGVLRRPPSGVTEDWPVVTLVRGTVAEQWTRVWGIQMPPTLRRFLIALGGGKSSLGGGSDMFLGAS